MARAALMAVAAAGMGWALTAGLPPAAAGAPIAGEACYVYGAGETLNGAKHIAISMAKRKALEGYPVFAEATSTMLDPQLKNDLIVNLTARALKGLRVTSESEDPQKREVCSAVQAEVEPEGLRTMIFAVARTFQRRSASLQTGLPQNGRLRVVKIEELPCAFDRAVQCLRVVVECVQNSFGERLPVRIIWYDADGLPSFSIKRRIGCESPRDLTNFMLRLPPPEYTYIVDLPP